MNGIPQAIGPYSAYQVQGDLVITSGQLAIDAESGKILGRTTYEQAKLCLKNLTHILNHAGSDWSHVLKLTVY